MAISLSVDTKDINKLQLALATIKGQLPFAASVALNNTAFQVKQAMKPATTQYFSNPTPFTQNAFRYTRSSKTDLIATVYADPSRKYLPTEIRGGTRRVKSYEAFLRGLSNGALPPGKLIPTSLTLNAAGNPKKALFAQIQSKLSTTDQGGFFIGTPKGTGRAPGVYRRSRGQLYPYFLTADEPRYQPRFPMERIGTDIARRVFPSELNKALTRALNSAR